MQQRGRGRKQDDATRKKELALQEGMLSMKARLLSAPCCAPVWPLAKWGGANQKARPTPTFEVVLLLVYWP